jgi:sec-independent protein translocase protein TatB
MFDIGFSEILLIFVIALVVLGPEKLPRAASQVGRWIGRARAMARQFKEQLEEEVNLENVRKAHKEAAAKEEKDAAAGVASSSSTGASADVGASGAASGADAAAGSAGGTTASMDAGTTVQTESSAATTVPPEAYTGPDPTEFRADTFSHAHPTNEYGANTLTPNGAPEEPKQQSAAEASVGSDAYTPGGPATGTPAAATPTSAPTANDAAREAVTATQTDNHGHS